MSMSIDGDIVVTPMDWIKGAFKANVTPLDSKTTYPVYGYVAYDIDDNLFGFMLYRCTDRLFIKFIIRIS